MIDEIAEDAKVTEILDTNDGGPVLEKAISLDKAEYVGVDSGLGDLLAICRMKNRKISCTIVEASGLPQKLPNGIGTSASAAAGVTNDDCTDTLEAELMPVWVESDVERTRVIEFIILRDSVKVLREGTLTEMSESTSQSNTFSGQMVKLRNGKLTKACNMEVATGECVLLEPDRTVYWYTFLL